VHMTSALSYSSLPWQLSPEPAHNTRHEAVVTIVSFLSSLHQTFHAEKHESTHGVSRYEQQAVDKLCREGHNKGTTAVGHGLLCLT